MEISSQSNINPNHITKIFNKYKIKSGIKLNKAFILKYFNYLAEHKLINFNETQKQIFLNNIKTKGIRTLSGVTTVTVMTKPYPCPGNCIYCPNDPKVPKSYISNEPGAQRAIQNNFDPYLQVSNRLQAYINTGHPVGKIELIIIGGTWSFYEPKYQVWFIRRCFDALNDFKKGNMKSILKSNELYSLKKELRILKSAHFNNESTLSRCVGLSIETRPDYINKKHLIFLRSLGITKIQLGVQSTNDRILKKINRGHTSKDTAEAIKLLRSMGFKIQIHWMPNLPGSNPKRDFEEYLKIFSSDKFKPDEIKIYPCSLVKNTSLEELYIKGKWKPYNKKTLINLLTKCLINTPRYCRITRMIRDISSEDILAGNKKSNLRQDVENLSLNEVVEEIRYREIKNKYDINQKPVYKHYLYNTTSGKEYFLEYTTENNKLLGFLRLHIPNRNTSTIDELLNSAIIREIHIYGQSLEINNMKRNNSVQHMGLGKKLLEKAILISKKRGVKRLSVISSVGTRQYYRSRGFIDGSLYQHFNLLTA